ncbi:DUF3800 domain-containing protein [Rhodopseudomonas palustris]|nr:DUF3800 domain-containing protein [Rhodopseudomonas palustris]
MAWFLFVDESGQDHKDSPYEVLAGVAILDSDLWDLIKELHDAEIAHFGRRYSEGKRELKAKAILKRKTFARAKGPELVLPNEVPSLSKAILDDGAENGSARHIKALSLAKIAYVTDVFSICESYDCRVFASIVDPNAQPTTGGGLRKDYGYLFERFFYFLEDMSTEQGYPQQGIVVFDELDKSKSHILIDQCHRYFKETAIGRHRSKLVLPEPFFVHSDLTTGIQIADLVAYCLSWGFRLATMDQPVREELAPYIEQLKRLRHRALRAMMGKADFEIWSFAYINDLRTMPEKGAIQ